MPAWACAIERHRLLEQLQRRLAAFQGGVVECHPAPYVEAVRARIRGRPSGRAAGRTKSQCIRDAPDNQILQRGGRFTGQ
jgi:hypothetical protein